MKPVYRSGGSPVILWRPFLGFLILCFACMIPLPGASHAADWSFNPSMSVSQQYDSNIRLLPNDSTNRISDFITSLTPELSLSRDTELTKLKLDTVTSIMKYARNPGFDTIDTASRICLATRWNERFSTDVGGIFVHDTTMEDQLDQSGIRTIRADRYRYEYVLGAKYAFSDRFSLPVTGSGGWSLYPSGEVPDQLDIRFNLAPAWVVTERDMIGLDITLAYKDYENGVEIYNSSHLLLWQRALSETLNMKLGAGYQIQFSDSSRAEGLSIAPGSPLPIGRSKARMDGLPIVLGELKKDWSERLCTSFSGGRRQFTDVDSRSFESNFVAGAARFLISELTAFNFNVKYYVNNEIEGGSREIDYMFVSPSIDRKLTENLSVSLIGSYERELTEKRSADTRADRCRVWIVLTYRWPRLIAGH